ncbi:hypothetical protein TIFTF001_024446 [Ficus carica]|uniref:Uncharacterized protein n=1 Tax=Ficus carica TaxID=3494 RepID=A0AA88DG27_FICCA|nr:hypothetical protein TIFTF001_024446 [Ficus carica]
MNQKNFACSPRLSYPPSTGHAMPCIKPLVTLWHYDAPQALEDEYKTWLSPKILKDYLDYVDFCFKTFGDRVKLWVTFNEPNAYSWNAYDRGTFAPGRCSSYVGKCPAGNSATEPYIAAHHFLLSHAAAVKLYRQKYQPHQKGKIGITIPTHWFVPKFDTEASRKAASRALDFLFGWFMDPVIFGDYPQSMRSIVGRRLPKFSEEQKKQLKGSIDFLGLNYYTGLYAESAPSSNDPNKSYSKDNQATTTTYKNGIPIGTPTALDWLFVYPKGIGEILLHIKEKYNNPDIYITENGVADANNKSLPIKEALKDNLRIGYFHDHLSYVLKAIKGGVNVKGYYLWTFWDDFEWDAGFTGDEKERRKKPPTKIWGLVAMIAGDPRIGAASQNLVQRATLPSSNEVRQWVGGFNGDLVDEDGGNKLPVGDNKCTWFGGGEAPTAATP